MKSGINHTLGQLTISHQLGNILVDLHVKVKFANIPINAVKVIFLTIMAH